MISLIKIWRAKRRLENLVRANRDSFAIQDYRKRRAAALKGLVRP